MIHTTQDPKYGIKDNKLVNMKTGKPIPDDEPVMIFRAKDKHASSAICNYMMDCKDLEHKSAVEKRWWQFCEFKENNPQKIKEPDTQP